jgi:hypothetical protein
MDYNRREAGCDVNRPGRARKSYQLVFRRHLGMHVWFLEIGLLGMPGALGHTQATLLPKESQSWC